MQKRTLRVYCSITAGQKGSLALLARTPPQGALRGLRHGVRLVQHNELERVVVHAKDVPGAGERLDLSAHNLDSAVVRRVKLGVSGTFSEPGRTSSTLLRKFFPYSLAARARMVVVLPVPGGP